MTWRPPFAIGLAALAACGGGPKPEAAAPRPRTLEEARAAAAAGGALPRAAMREARVGLKAGWMDAGEAIANLRVVSRTPPSADFLPQTPGDFRYINSDIAFAGSYALQGNFSGVQVWDISNPARPTLKRAFVCPGSQSDVSVYRHLLFVSGEALDGRVDCGTEGVQDPVSHHRLRGIRIFDIRDIANPTLLTNVQTCRGSHTHTVVTSPRDTAHVYIYVSGSAPVRSPRELAGCSMALPEDDPTSALFRIEVIQVPLAAPAQAKLVSFPRIFAGLTEPKSHGPAPEDVAAAKANAEAARAQGLFTTVFEGQEVVVPPNLTRPMLDSIVRARNGSGAPTAADSAALRAALPGLLERMFQDAPGTAGRGPTQCHDITVFAEIGRAGGACEGYGLLLDIRDVANPRRLSAVADSNFAYWHSATFNNDGTRILFTDEWGGGLQARCRVTDKKEWGANAIFTIADSTMTFRSYYKLPAPQTRQENCVAHNGSLIPVPGRDIMVQAWYQGGISVFDWTNPARPVEIAYFDRGPMDSTKLVSGGSWSAYWYNGYIYSSEIARGLDVLELVPSAQLSQNEIDAAKLVRQDYFNAQQQRRFEWPAAFVVARAYLDQLERGHGLAADRIAFVRTELDRYERSGDRQALQALAGRLDRDASGAPDGRRARLLAEVVRELGR